MTRKQYAEKYYKIFSTAEGNQHIASLFAIRKVLDIISANRPIKILEVGLGIGSIAYSVIGYMNSQRLPFSYYGTEKNEFCLSQLSINLKEKMNQVRVFDDISAVPSNVMFDLVIIDGSDDSLAQIKGIIAAHGIIFIEGDRVSQVNVMQQLFPRHRYVHTVSAMREPAHSPFGAGKWSGGGKLIFTDPTFFQLLEYFKERMSTGINYRIRSISKS